MPAPSPQSPNPGRIMAMMTGFEQTAALDAAVELDLFTHIGSAAPGHAGAADLAGAVKASERGLAVLADALAALGLLVKHDGQYSLTPEATLFLDRRSPECIASVANWYGFVARRGAPDEVAAAVRRGGADPEAPRPPAEQWVTFARCMAPMMQRPAEFVADLASGLAQAGEGARVLDLAGGHGLYGIALARRHDNVAVTLVDAEPVLAVARDHASRAGVAERFHTQAGSILPGTEGEVALGQDYRMVLVTGFLHMLGPGMIVKLLAKARAALAPGGHLVITDFIVNEDRVSPPFAAMFSLVMLAATPEGRTYTMAEFERMFADAGFGSLERHDVPGTPISALVAAR